MLCDGIRLYFAEYYRQSTIKNNNISLTMTYRSDADGQEIHTCTS